MAVLLWCALRSALYCGYLGGFPFQLEQREAAEMRSALAMEEGRNPWDPRFAPQDFNSYGPLYPWVAARVLPGSHQDIRDFRRLSIAALVLAALLVGAAAWSMSGSALAGAAGALTAMGGYLFFVTPTARCDAFAALFFIVPLALPALGRGRLLLAGCALVAALAFLVKPYAGVAGPALCLLLAAEGRWKAAWAAGFLWLALLMAFAAGAELLWPGYLESTVFLLANVVPYSLKYLVFQTTAYLRVALPLFVLAGAAWWRFKPSRQALAWCAPALAMVLLLLWLGCNPGAFLEYHFQLLHPCLVLAAASLWRGRLSGKRWLEAGLTWAAFTSVACGTSTLGRVASMPLDPWIVAERLVASAHSPFVPPILTSVATDFGKPVADNGLTETLAYAGGGATGVALRRSERVWAASWERGLADHSVDLVFSDSRRPVSPGLLAAYALEGSLWLPELITEEADPARYDVYRLNPAATRPGGAAQKGPTTRRKP